ncbi:MAG: polysaccharide biosynthesis protein, partial [Ruminococcaceae bacterium]|nr:polysaccharide biosynthesis protein [Oscillospiraceae bacterium]
MNLFGKSKVNALLFMLLDIFIINLSVFLALFTRFEFSMTYFLQQGYWEVARQVMVPGTIVSIFSLLIFHVYSTMWKFASAYELFNTAMASAVAASLYMVVVIVMQLSLPRSFPFLYALILFVLICASRFLIQLVVSVNHGVSVFQITKDRNKKRTMVIGAGAAGAMIIKEFKASDLSHNSVVCVIDDDRTKHGRRVRGVKVIGGRECIEDVVNKFNIEEIIFCIPSASLQERNEILEICSATGAKLKSLPSLSQLANEDVSVNQIREVSIDDLLGRTQVHTDNTVISGRVWGKTVLVTGGGGSIGSELCRQLADLTPGKLIIFDIYENNAYDIQQELKRKHPELDLEVLIGSVRDEARVNYIFDAYRPDLVCHAAAHKHVPLMEDSPAEAIKNNVFGTYNVAKAAGESGTRLFILVSTDKAVNPTNVMGASKRLCEMVVQSM